VNTNSSFNRRHEPAIPRGDPAEERGAAGEAGPGGRRLGAAPDARAR